MEKEYNRRRKRKERKNGSKNGIGLKRDTINQTEKMGLKFLHRQLYQYRRYSPVLPLLACLAQVGQSLLAILLSKFVLDAVTGGMEFRDRKSVV